MSVREFEIRIDVTEAAATGDHLETAATITVDHAHELFEPAVVCFAFPGAGYNRRYFTFDMPGCTGGGQAGWHARLGWIFVSCDHVSVGDSSSPQDPTTLSYENLAAANAATVVEVLRRLRLGEVEADLPPIRLGVVLGLGQSMGGCLAIICQAHHGVFDGLGVLGFSAVQTVLPVPPGSPQIPIPPLRRGEFPDLAAGAPPPASTTDPPTAADLPPTAWGFHYDDVAEELVVADMVDYPARRGRMPVWGTPSFPLCAFSMMSPGVVADEAASVDVPVLVAVGERDVCPDPWSEPQAYRRCHDVTVYEAPRMAHMHNFADSRALLWERIHAWGQGVAFTQRVPSQRDS